MQKISFSKEHSNDYSCLECPTCNSSYLHQNMYAVFSRREDMPSQVRYVAAITGNVTDNQPTEHNPSDRRQALSIYFMCESCAEEKILSIMQHKGQTFLEWQE